MVIAGHGSDISFSLLVILYPNGILCAPPCQKEHFGGCYKARSGKWILKSATLTQPPHYDNMNLYLSKRSPIHSNFTDDEGKVLYKVDTPMKVTGRTSTITRATPEELLRLEEGIDMHDRFEILAQIEYKTLASSVIKFGETEVKTGAYFRKEGWGPYGR